MLETFIETFVYAMPHNKSDPLEMCPVSDLLWAEQATLSGWWGYKGVSWSFLWLLARVSANQKEKKRKTWSLGVVQKYRVGVGAPYDIYK